MFPDLQYEIVSCTARGGEAPRPAVALPVPGHRGGQSVCRTKGGPPEAGVLPVSGQPGSLHGPGARFRRQRPTWASASEDQTLTVVMKIKKEKRNNEFNPVRPGLLLKNSNKSTTSPVCADPGGARLSARSAPHRAQCSWVLVNKWLASDKETHKTGLRGRKCLGCKTSL